jgi:single-strand DNA-binding protein
MAGLNKACLLGHLGKDPSIKSNSSGDKFATFSLATSESWRDKQTGDRKERTEWHNCVCYNEALTKVIEQYCKKGSQIYIEGQIQTRKWQDQSGADRWSTEIVMKAFDSKLVLLGGKPDGERGERDDAPAETTGRKAVGKAKASQPPDDMDSDIPF